MVAKRGRNGRARTPPVKSKKKGLHHLHHGSKKGHHPVSPLAKDGGGSSNKRKCFQEACYAIENTNMDEDDEFFAAVGKDGKFGSGSAMNGYGSKRSNKEVQCNKKGCCKKFSGVNALRFHLSYAHNELKAKHEAEKAKKRKAKEEEERERERKRLKAKAEDQQRKENEELQQRLIHGKVDAHFGRSLEGLVGPGQSGGVGGVGGVGLNLVKTPTASPQQQQLQQVSPSGRVTAVVKPIQQQYPNGALYKPPAPPPGLQNGNLAAAPGPASAAAAAAAAASRRPASPAYSDISDEEPDGGGKPIALVGSSKGQPGPSGMSPARQNKPGSGISVKPEFSAPKEHHHPAIATAAVKPTSQTQQGNLPPPPPGMLGHPGLSLPGLIPGLPPGAAAAASSMHLGSQGAAAAAALAAADQHQLMAFMDLMQQQATASQYLSATSKLQELQERALGGGHFRPAAAPAVTAPRLPPGAPHHHHHHHHARSSSSGTTLSSSGLPSTMISPSITPSSSSSSAAADHRHLQQQHHHHPHHHARHHHQHQQHPSTSSSPSSRPPQPAPAHQSSLPSGFSLALPPTAVSTAPQPQGAIFGSPTTSFPGNFCFNVFFFFLQYGNVSKMCYHSCSSRHPQKFKNAVDLSLEVMKKTPMMKKT